MSEYKYVSLLFFNMSNQKLEIKCITPYPVHIFLVHMTTPHSYMTIPFTDNHHHYFSTFTCDHLVHATIPRSHMTPFTHDQPVQTTTAWFTCDHPLHMSPVLMTTSRSHEVLTTQFTHGHTMDISPVYTWPGYGTEKMFRLVSIIKPYMDQTLDLYLVTDHT